MNADVLSIVAKANRVVSMCGTRDSHRICKELGIEIMYCPFKMQKGAYSVIMRNRFVFLKNDLDPITENIVLLHELGHDSLHRTQATKTGGFKEFNIFDINGSRMEYEANIFASQIALPDDEFLELAQMGYDMSQIAESLNSDINLVAVKTDLLISQGYELRHFEHKNDFLKYQLKRESGYV